MPSGIWKPFILTLAVDYVIDGVECSLVVEAKLVDKLIQSADDLVSLVYTGADSTPGGGTRDTGYYVVVNDIDASALTLPAAKHAWENDLGFCGVLEGNGHTISNLNVAAWTNGLFGALGAGSKVQNLRFENVTMGEGAYLFALVMRKTNFSNVDIVFSVNTSSSLFADTINESTFADVTVKTSAGAPLCWNIDNAKAEDIPVGITVSHYDYHTVTFNTDGGNEIAPAYVTVGTTLKKPVDPEKTSELYDCVFLGWYNGETEWDFNTVLTEDITLVAKWEEISKAPEGVLLYAKTQTLTKWDYGNDITVGRTIDDTYGDVWTVTLSDIAEQSLQHPAIDTTGYEKVYFYIYNPCASVVRMVIHGGYGEGWNLAETQLVASGWTKVELDVSVFAKGDAGKIFPVLQDPAGVSIAGEWMITSFFGLKAGETAPEVEATTNVLLDAAKQTIEKSCSYGGDIVVEAATDADYGDLWKITVGDFAEQGFHHTAIDTAGFERVYFYIYNPCAYEVRLTIHGGWTDWGVATIMLPAESWTKVELNATVFTSDVAGKIFPVLQDPNAVSLAGEWKITSFYGLKAGEEAPEIEVTTNVLLDASKQTIEKSCSYGGDIVVEAATDATYGDLWKITVSDLAEQGFHHAAIDTTGYEKVYFYIYNPCAYEVRLTIHGGWTDWGVATIMLPAESWTKVELNATVFTSDVAGKIFPVLQDPNAVSLAGEWKITSFYGLKTGETASEV